MAAESQRYAIVVGRFYEELAEKLVASARAAFEEAGGEVDVFDVPGAYELPLAARYCADSGRYAGVAALGAVIRGETYHFELVSNESGAGITRVGLDYGMPIANAVLTTENDEQAEARMADKGTDAARVAVEMANLLLGLEELQAEEE